MIMKSRHRPIRILLIGLCGASLSSGSLAQQAPQKDSAGKIQAFGLDTKAQARCAQEVRKIQAALVHNRKIDFKTWENRCPAFAAPIKSIETLSPPLQRGALLMLFGGDYGSQGYGGRCWFGAGPLC
jgi:hypothetical protein